MTEEEMRQEMEDGAREYRQEVLRVSQELGVSLFCANDIVYLRSRHRHTPQLEAELIQRYKDGNPPEDMGTFGVTEETQQNLMNEVHRMLNELF